MLVAGEIGGKTKFEATADLVKNAVFVGLTIHSSLQTGRGPAGAPAAAGGRRGGFSAVPLTASPVLCRTYHLLGRWEATE